MVAGGYPARVFGTFPAQLSFHLRACYVPNIGAAALGTKAEAMCLPAGPRPSSELLTPLTDRAAPSSAPSCLPGTLVPGEAVRPHSLMEEGGAAPEEMRPWGLQALVCGPRRKSTFA